MAKTKTKLKRALKQEVPEITEKMTTGMPPSMSPEQEELQRIRAEIAIKAARRLNVELDREELNLINIEGLSKISGYGYY